ncbi:NucA/NucB deoxyribonuclease domain-containing protein [Enterocloster lavalensis]|uniref:NucA/NucB deoxyribonuclease domain-containing protein n=1 Tax=Enterocloster lavalensis TaxID=460384 RepID=UPI001D076F86|nr:NucA/NucB deoxyribonuclease domain-containing protein [Enterocloster lavalensis]MCB6344139.1 hypothetical protein [Enterocloster lavalensis]
MSDFNVVISAVDRGMDMMDTYANELEDLRAHAAFDLNSLFDRVDRSIRLCRCEYGLARLERLRYACETVGAELLSGWNASCVYCAELSEQGKYLMGQYVYNLSKIESREAGGGVAGIVPPDSYIVCIVDSRRYPQTAEHIKAAQKSGMPELVTIGRSEASRRRKQSLAGVRASTVYDRDEYPMALFCEGGAGADIAYIEGADNRGAGSCISWQLRGFSDGTRVRVRVI